MAWPLTKLLALPWNIGWVSLGCKWSLLSLTANGTGAPVVYKRTASSDGNKCRENPIGNFMCIDRFTFGWELHVRNEEVTNKQASNNLLYTCAHAAMMTAITPPEATAITMLIAMIAGTRWYEDTLSLVGAACAVLKCDKYNTIILHGRKPLFKRKLLHSSHWMLSVDPQLNANLHTFEGTFCTLYTRNR